MSYTRLLFLVALILSVTGCSEELVSPGGSDFPEKQTPYESFFDLEILKQRRNDLIARLPAYSLVVIATNDVYPRNGDIAYEFRPASTFYYLTGFTEPNAAAIIKESASGSTHSDLVMFVEERSNDEERWLGPTYGPEGAVEHFGAGVAYEIGALGSVLDEHLQTGRYQRIYANLGDNETVSSLINAAQGELDGIFDVESVVDAQRVVKTPIEIEAIRRAVAVSVQAFLEAMDVIKPGMYEYEVDAVMDFVLRVNGSSTAAFPTIVASGPNSSVLHYDANQRQMQDGELVMIDFGAEYAYYASDVTRTLPVGGTYSSAQATVYNIVLDTHRAVIAVAKPGVTYEFLYEFARDMVLDGLLTEGIIAGDRSEIISSGRFRQYIPAGLGHCVGLDVHDPFPSDNGGERILKRNMVLALEPHIYLAEGDLTVAETYRGVSARIEDTIRITVDGAEVLSRSIPVEIAKIEERMRY